MDIDEIKAYEEKLMRGATILGYDVAEGKDRTVVNINLNGVVVGPEDKLVLTLREGYEWSAAAQAELLTALRNCGIDRRRVVVCTGVDAAVVKPPTHPTDTRCGDKVNDPLPVPPGYHVKSERISNTHGLLISYEEDTLEQVAAQSVGKPFKDQKGNVLGTVERAWVEDSKVLQSIAWGKVPDGACVKVNDPPAEPGNATVMSKEDWIGSVVDVPVKPFPDLRQLEKEPARPCGYCDGTGIVQPDQTHHARQERTECPVCGGKGSR